MVNRRNTARIVRLFLFGKRRLLSGTRASTVQPLSSIRPLLYQTMSNPVSRFPWTLIMPSSWMPRALSMNVKPDCWSLNVSRMRPTMSSVSIPSRLLTAALTLSGSVSNARTAK